MKVMSKLKTVIKILSIPILLVAFYFLTRYSLLKWGSLRVETDSTITVRGTYTMQVQNQVATYNIGFNTTNANRDEAVKNVNDRTDNFVKVMTEYGIQPNDIQTTNKNIYQREEPYYDNGVQKFKKTDWTASTNITVVLRDIQKTDEFSGKVYSLDVSDVNGPYFSLDFNADKDVEILKKAMQNADTKAKALAQEKNKMLGEIVSISEDDTQGGAVPFFNKGMGMGAGGAGGGGGAQIGASTVTKSITITYKMY